MAMLILMSAAAFGSLRGASAALPILLLIGFLVLGRALGSLPSGPLWGAAISRMLGSRVLGPRAATDSGVGRGFANTDEGCEFAGGAQLDSLAGGLPTVPPFSMLFVPSRRITGRLGASSWEIVRTNQGGSPKLPYSGLDWCPAFARARPAAARSGRASTGQTQRSVLGPLPADNGRNTQPPNGPISA